MKNIYKYFLVFICFVFMSSSTYAGCPTDVDDIYKVENLSCTGDCEDLYVQDAFDEKKYYLRNDSNCQHCDSLFIQAFIKYEGVTLTANGYVGGHLVLGDVYLNDKDITRGYVGPSIYDENLWKEDLKVTFDDRIFFIKLQQVEEGPLIKEINCEKNCDNIEITTNPIEDREARITIYDQCLKGNNCSVILLNNYPECGEGYGTHTYFKKSNFENRNDTSEYFAAEELQDSNRIIATFDQTTISYDLVKDKKAKAIFKQKDTKKEEKDVKKEITNQNVFFVGFGIILLALIVTTVVIILRKKKR